MFTRSSCKTNDTMNVCTPFENIRKSCEKYQSDKKYVYKGCNSGLFLPREWIVVMEKCKDTITSEERNDVVDEKYAKFRANELMVIEIINVYDGTSRATHIINASGYSDFLKYEVGKIVKCDKFDSNIDKVCSGGIHYYKTLIAAYYYCASAINKRHDDKWTEWYDNGRKKCETSYKNGIIHGLYIKWYLNGQKYIEVHYERGKIISTTRWSPDGMTKWDANGTILDKGITTSTPQVTTSTPQVTTSTKG